MISLVSWKSKQGDVVIGKGGWFVMLVDEKLEDAKYLFFLYNFVLIARCTKWSGQI